MPETGPNGGCYYCVGEDSEDQECFDCLACDARCCQDHGRAVTAAEKKAGNPADFVCDCHGPLDSSGQDYEAYIDEMWIAR